MLMSRSYIVVSIVYNLVSRTHMLVSSSYIVVSIVYNLVSRIHMLVSTTYILVSTKYNLVSRTHVLLSRSPSVTIKIIYDSEHNKYFSERNNYFNEHLHMLCMQEKSTSTKERERPNDRAPLLSFCAENNQDYRGFVSPGKDHI